MNPLIGLLLIPAVAAEPDVTAHGRVLVGELNCMACHAADTVTNGITPKQGPRLADLGSRSRCCRRRRHRGRWRRARRSGSVRIIDGTGITHSSLSDLGDARILAVSRHAARLGPGDHFDLRQRVPSPADETADQNP